MEATPMGAAQVRFYLRFLLNAFRKVGQYARVSSRSRSARRLHESRDFFSETRSERLVWVTITGNIGRLVTSRNGFQDMVDAVQVECRGLLYSAAGQWTHVAILSSRASQLIGGGHGDWLLAPLAGAIVMFAGGFVAAIRSGSFRIRFDGLALAARYALGRCLMGIATDLIPGGNGTNLVYGIPSLASHAWLAYAAMSVSLITVFAIIGRMQR